MKCKIKILCEKNLYVKNYAVKEKNDINLND